MATTRTPQWTVDACEHRWQYFVDVATRKVRSRVCSVCGQRQQMPAPEPTVAKGRLSA